MCSQELVQAGATLRDPHCSGENERHMWWAKIECEMNSAHSAIRQGTKNVTDEPTEIQNSLSKIKDPSLKHMHSSIDRGARDPNCASLDAMSESKEEILRKHPNAHDANKNTRCVKQTTTKKHQNHEHQNHQNQPRGGNGSDCHPDAKLITLKNGNKIRHHHTFTFDSDDFCFFANQQQQTLFIERKNANQNHKGNDQRGN